MFKDGQAIIIQVWMLICEKQLPNICLCHSGTYEFWRSCPSAMRQANFILCGQFFSHCTATHCIDSDVFASCHLKYIIKNVRNAMRCITPHRCEPAFTATISKLHSPYIDCEENQRVKPLYSKKKTSWELYWLRHGFWPSPGRLHPFFATPYSPFFIPECNDGPMSHHMWWYA